MVTQSVWLGRARRQDMDDLLPLRDERVGDELAVDMSGLKRLIREIHRRSLWQVLGIYLVASWVVFQVIQTLTEGLGLPE